MMLNSWIADEPFASDRGFLERGIERYQAGDYISAVSVLLPRIEGRMVREVFRPEGREHRGRRYLSTVRRFPNPAYVLRMGMSRAQQQPSLYDLGDVLHLLAETTSCGRLGQRLQGAADFLGFAVRGPQALLPLLDDLPPYERHHRQAAAIALAALDHVVPHDQVVVGPDDWEGLYSYGVLLGISPLTPRERHDRLDALQPWVSLGLREWIREMKRRALEGDTVTIPM
ncbi:MAG: hypothetical protein ACREMX_16200 [Gemmatimonadales bacterium]